MDEVRDTSQSQPTGEAVPNPAEAEAAGMPGGSEAPEMTPVDSISKEMEQLRARLQQDEAGASRRINELTNEATQARSDLQQSQAEVSRLNQQLQQPQARQYSDDDPYADQSQQNQPRVANEDQDARDAIIALDRTVQTLQTTLEKERSTATAIMEIQKQYGIPRQDAETAVALINQGQQVKGGMYAHKAAERERLRKEAQSASRREQAPPMTGAGAASGGTASALEVSDSDLDDIMSGKLTPSQTAARFSENPGLIQRIEDRKKNKRAT